MIAASTLGFLPLEEISLAKHKRQRKSVNDKSRGLQETVPSLENLVPIGASIEAPPMSSLSSEENVPPPEELKLTIGRDTSREVVPVSFSEHHPSPSGVDRGDDGAHGKGPSEVSQLPALSSSMLIRNEGEGENEGGQKDPFRPGSLENMMHLFQHGTVAAMELELARVGMKGLRALRTPDVRKVTFEISLSALSKARSGASGRF